jgi:metal-dependent hydrolase (beta-lactamase superfamily II)
MKVTVLTDNLDGDSLKGEWGLSHLIEYGDKVILLDARLCA